MGGWVQGVVGLVCRVLHPLLHHLYLLLLHLYLRLQRLRCPGQRLPWPVLHLHLPPPQLLRLLLHLPLRVPPCL